MTKFLVLALAAVALLAPLPAFSGAATALTAYIKNCQTEGVDPDTRVAACTTVIHSNLFAGRLLADLYAIRARAYIAKQDYQDALADENKALELKPDFPEAQANKAKLEEMLQAAGAAQTDTAGSPAKP